VVARCCFEECIQVEFVLGVVQCDTGKAECAKNVGDAVVKRVFFFVSSK